MQVLVALLLLVAGTYTAPQPDMLLDSSPWKSYEKWNLRKHKPTGDLTGQEIDSKKKKSEKEVQNEVLVETFLANVKEKLTGKQMHNMLSQALKEAQDQLAGVTNDTAPETEGRDLNEYVTSRKIGSPSRDWFKKIDHLDLGFDKAEDKDFDFDKAKDENWGFDLHYLSNDDNLTPFNIGHDVSAGNHKQGSTVDVFGQPLSPRPSSSASTSSFRLSAVGKDRPGSKLPEPDIFSLFEAEIPEFDGQEDVSWDEFESPVNWNMFSDDKNGINWPQTDDLYKFGSENDGFDTNQEDIFKLTDYLPFLESQIPDLNNVSSSFNETALDNVDDGTRIEFKQGSSTSSDGFTSKESWKQVYKVHAENDSTATMEMEDEEFKGDIFDQAGHSLVSASKVFGKGIQESNGQGLMKQERHKGQALVFPGQSQDLVRQNGASIKRRYRSLTDDTKETSGNDVETLSDVEEDVMRDLSDDTKVNKGKANSQGLMTLDPDAEILDLKQILKTQAELS